jgi:Domain of unknown function (DUF4160)
MAAVFRHSRYRVVIYSNDHRPAHVHVIRGKGKGETEAVFNLHCPLGPPELREVDEGVATRELKGILEWLAEALGGLCISWSKIHGDY